MLALSLTLPHALVLPATVTVPQPPPAMAHHHQLMVETQLLARPSLSQDAGIFPGDQHHLPAMLVADDKELTEEEEEKRDFARKLAGIIFFLGAAPSFYAQYELVWKKEWEKD